MILPIMLFVCAAYFCLRKTKEEKNYDRFMQCVARGDELCDSQEWCDCIGIKHDDQL